MAVVDSVAAVVDSVVAVAGSFAAVAAIVILTNIDVLCSKCQPPTPNSVMGFFNKDINMEACFEFL